MRPRQVRYQAALRPDSSGSDSTGKHGNCIRRRVRDPDIINPSTLGRFSPRKRCGTDALISGGSLPASEPPRRYCFFVSPLRSKVGAFFCGV